MNRRSGMYKRRRNGERGVTMVLVAVALTTLLALAALAVDMGMIALARTHAQHAADAAALAGAYTFLNDKAAQPGSAQQAAIAAAGANKVLGAPVTLTAADVTVDTANRRVVVAVNRTGANAVRTNFAAAVGVNTVGLRAVATAQCSPVAGGTRCLKPLYVPNTILSTKAAAAACTQNEVVFDPTTKQLSAFATSYFNSAKVNTASVLRPTDSNKAVAPGQYYSLDFGSGATTYQCTISKCLNNCSLANTIKCGDQFPLETGNMVGPTEQGFASLIGNPPQDAWVGVGQYRSVSTGIVKDSSDALVTVPVWDNCAQPITPGKSGQKMVVIGFVEMFVDNVSHSGSTKGDTTAHFVSATSCSTSNGGGGGNPNPSGNPPTGPFAKPIQLIQNPGN